MRNARRMRKIDITNAATINRAFCKTPLLLMFCFKFLHAIHKRLHAFDAHGVVAGGTETAHGAVALDALHTGCGGVLLELGFEFFVFFLHHEANVHQRAVFFLCRAAEEFVAVDFAVEQFGASLGAAFHFFHAALRLNPFQILQGAVDRHNGRGVEHRAFIDVRAIVEHRGNGAAHLAEQFFFDNHEGNARHREVLLRTAVYQAIFCHQLQH